MPCPQAITAYFLAKEIPISFSRKKMISRQPAITVTGIILPDRSGPDNTLSDCGASTSVTPEIRPRKKKIHDNLISLRTDLLFACSLYISAISSSSKSLKGISRLLSDSNSLKYLSWLLFFSISIVFSFLLTIRH